MKFNQKMFIFHIYSNLKLIGSLHKNVNSTAPPRKFFMATALPTTIGFLSISIYKNSKRAGWGQAGSMLLWPVARLTALEQTPWSIIYTITNHYASGEKWKKREKNYIIQPFNNPILDYSTSTSDPGVHLIDSGGTFGKWICNRLRVELITLKLIKMDNFSGGY